VGLSEFAKSRCADGMDRQIRGLVPAKRGVRLTLRKAGAKPSGLGLPAATPRLKGSAKNRCAGTAIRLGAQTAVPAGFEPTAHNASD